MLGLSVSSKTGLYDYMCDCCRHSGGTSDAGEESKQENAYMAWWRIKVVEKL